VSPAPYDLHSELPSGYGYELPNSPRWARWDYGRHTFSISRARREGQLIEAKWPELSIRRYSRRLSARSFGTDGAEAGLPLELGTTSSRAFSSAPTAVDQ